MDPADLNAIALRLGKKRLSKRLRQQIKMSATLFGEGLGRFHWENLTIIPKLLNIGLKSLGLLERGRRNTLDFRVEEEIFVFKNLPTAFHDFRILQLSDLHIDGMLDSGESLKRIIDGLDFDLCVLTGDFRFRTVHDYGETTRRMESLMEVLTCPEGVLGILGNHDFIEKAPLFERLGIRMLLNESVAISRGSDTIHVLGVDDPHFYGTHDIYQAFEQVVEDNFKLLLVHSPEIINTAAETGVDLYLCGHTHGGQICLPGRIPILVNANCKRRFCSGRWQHAEMHGYTSRGTGSSTFPVRFFCPPELTLHRLQRPS